jgi:anaerobic nitric oxide reductase transcription regulator
LISRAVLKSLSVYKERPRILTIETAVLGLGDEIAVAAPVMVSPSGAVPGGSLKDSVDAFQRRLIEEALLRHQGKWIEVAREMGLDRANLSRLARRLGIR